MPARVWICALALLPLACDDAGPAPVATGERDGGARYYRQLSEQEVLPDLDPAQRVDFDTAESLAHVYVVHLDDAGRVATVERVDAGQTQWLRRYLYDDGGRLTQRETIRRDRSRLVERLDAAGRPVAEGADAPAATVTAENDRT